MIVVSSLNVIQMLNIMISIALTLVLNRLVLSSCSFDPCSSVQHEALKREKNRLSTENEHSYRQYELRYFC